MLPPFIITDAKPVSTSVATPLTSIDGETPGARVTVSAMVLVGATAGSLSVTVVALLTVDVPKALLRSLSVKVVVTALSE